MKEVLQEASGVFVIIKNDGQKNVSRYKIGEMPTLRSVFRMVPGLCNTTQLKHMHLCQWYLAEILIEKNQSPLFQVSTGNEQNPFEE